jgi:hypothetical protein
MPNLARAAARDDQVAALLRDRGPATTAELWDAAGYQHTRPRPFEYVALYASLRRVERVGLARGIRTSDRRHGVLWAWAAPEKEGADG